MAESSSSMVRQGGNFSHSSKSFGINFLKQHHPVQRRTRTQNVSASQKKAHRNSREKSSEVSVRTHELRSSTAGQNCTSDSTLSFCWPAPDQTDRNDSAGRTNLPITCLLSKNFQMSSAPSLRCDKCDFATSRLSNIVTHNKLMHSPMKQWSGPAFSCDISPGNSRLDVATDETITLSGCMKKSRNMDDKSSNNRSSDLLQHNPDEYILDQISEIKVNTHEDWNELPDIISPDVTSPEPKALLSEGDLVWVKAYRNPFWPAVVKKIYRVKNKLKRVSVLFLQNGSVRKPFTILSTRIGKKLLPFGNDCEKHDRLVKEACTSNYGEEAQYILHKIDEYLLMKRQGKINCSALKYFHLTSQVRNKAVEEETDSSSLVDIMQNNDAFFMSEEGNSDSHYKSSAHLKSCLKKRYVSCQMLLDYCKTPAIKDYMKNLLSGEVYSQRRELYNKPSLEACEKSVLRNVSFGPVEDEEQQNQLIDILNNQYKSISRVESYQDMKYFTEVVLPECIIHAIQVTFRKPHNKAEELYNEGFTLSREEREEQQKQLRSTLKRAEPKAANHHHYKISCRLYLKS